MDEQLNGTLKIDKSDGVSKGFIRICPYTLLDDIPEMLSEWWASSGKNMSAFLQDEGLAEVMNEQMFTEVLLGKYYFSEHFLVLLKEKFPYNITLDKLHTLNERSFRKCPGIAKLKTDDDVIISILRKIYVDKKENRIQSVAEWHHNHKDRAAAATERYRQFHVEKIKEYKRQYRETHKEEIKAYKASRRTAENEKQRRRYHEDIEKSREQNRKRHQAYKEKHKDKIKAQQAQYRAKHREEIRERANQRMADETYRLRVRARARVLYAERAAEIQEKRRQSRLQNIEKAKQQERKYGETYREKHREEIRERNREKYQSNLLENRQKNAEKQRKIRAKKRFQTQTGATVLSLLSAIAAAKNQSAKD